MNNLYDIMESITNTPGRAMCESILDDENEIFDRVDKGIQMKVNVDWLREHGVKYRLEHVIEDPTRYSHLYNSDTKEWNLEDAELVLKKGDEVPRTLKISRLRSLKLIEYDEEILPEIAKSVIDLLSIRNCSKLKSLQGCPTELKKIAVSGCPKLKSLDGCPKVVHDMFKFINNGVKVTDKDIKKYCKVNKKNMIF